MNKQLNMRNRIIIIIISVILISCKTNQNITGRYRSNFADLGFFITEIDLKPNKSFHYVFSGDLIHTELDGKYEIRGNKLYVRFNQLKNKSNNTADNLSISIGQENTHSYDLKSEYGIEYHLKYRIHKAKLQSYTETSGKLVRRAKIYTDKRKFVFIGPKIYKKKWYLKKII